MGNFFFSANSWFQLFLYSLWQNSDIDMFYFYHIQICNEKLGTFGSSERLSALIQPLVVGVTCTHRPFFSHWKITVLLAFNGFTCFYLLVKKLYKSWVILCDDFFEVLSLRSYYWHGIVIWIFIHIIILIYIIILIIIVIFPPKGFNSYLSKNICLLWILTFDTNPITFWPAWNFWLSLVIESSILLKKNRI